MSDGLILCRSLTNAQKFTRCLEQCGLKGRVVRTPGELTNNGCGYAVAVPRPQIGGSLATLRKYGYRPGKAIIRDNDQYREWTP